MALFVAMIQYPIILIAEYISRQCLWPVLLCAPHKRPKSYIAIRRKHLLLTGKIGTFPTAFNVFISATITLIACVGMGASVSFAATFTIRNFTAQSAYQTARSNRLYQFILAFLKSAAVLCVIYFLLTYVMSCV